jgi:hypothetical protein
LAAESGQRAEDPQEDLLREIESFLAVAHEMSGKTQHEPVMLEDELGMCRVITRQTALDESRFTAGDFGGPPDGFGRLYKMSRHVGTPGI